MVTLGFICLTLLVMRLQSICDVPDADRKRYRRRLLSPFAQEERRTSFVVGVYLSHKARFIQRNTPSPCFCREEKTSRSTRFPNRLLREQGNVREFWFTTRVYFIFLVQLSDEAILTSRRIVSSIQRLKPLFYEDFNFIIVKLWPINPASAFMRGWLRGFPAQFKRPVQTWVLSHRMLGWPPTKLNKVLNRFW